MITADHFAAIVQRIGRHTNANEMMRLANELAALTAQLRNEQSEFRMQCELGLQVKHHCPAMYACAYIYGQFLVADDDAQREQKVPT